MSLFDTLVQSLDRMLSKPDIVSPEEEQGHLDLLELSKGRVNDTLDAIRAGNLVAAASTIEDVNVTREMRYQDMIHSTRPQKTGFAHHLEKPTGQAHLDRLAAQDAADPVRER